MKGAGLPLRVQGVIVEQGPTDTGGVSSPGGAIVSQGVATVLADPLVASIDVGAAIYPDSARFAKRAVASGRPACVNVQIQRAGAPAVSRRSPR